jgi:hypothetical protein
MKSAALCRASLQRVAQGWISDLGAFPSSAEYRTVDKPRGRYTLPGRAIVTRMRVFVRTPPISGQKLELR